MSTEKFDQLCAKIDDEGFTDPIKVCPVPEAEVVSSWPPDKKHYWIWAGEHRWRYAIVKELTQVPCAIYEGVEWGEYAQKLATVRDNFVHGDMNAKKFTELVRSLDEDLSVDPTVFGFVDQAEMDKYLIREREAREKNFLDGFLDAANQQKEAVDGISDVVSTIFQQCAHTVDQNYLAFTFKGNAVCIVLCDKSCYGRVQEMIGHLQVTGGDINTFMKEALTRGLITTAPPAPRAPETVEDSPENSTQLES